MLHHPLLTIEIDVLLLLAIACLTAIALKRLQFPYTVALMLLGIGIGWMGETIEGFDFFPTLTLSHTLILFVFVPPLIFESALNLDSRLLLRNLIPILTLAAPGLLLSTAIVGGILSWGTNLELPQALLFGSLISATDPVAVIALFKELGVPKRLGILIEGESLFNDATAIATFNIILAVMASGQGFGLSSLQQGSIAFLISFLGGVAVGGLVGFLMELPITLSKDNPLVLATFTTIVAYGTFLIAEEVVHVSGVIGVVSAGIVLGWYKTNNLKPVARQFLNEFWEYLAFLANSLIFLLVGLTVSRLQFFHQIQHTQDLLGAIALTLLAILFARAIVVFGLTAIINRLQPEQLVDWQYQLVSWWGGLRGAVCLALALSFDSDFPNRDLMLMLTLGVVLFTLLIPGTTIAMLLQRLGLDLPPLFDRLNQALARSLAAKGALEQLPQIETTFIDPKPAILAGYQQNCQRELTKSQTALMALYDSAKKDDVILQQWIWSLALSLEQKIYQTLYDEGFMGEAFLSQFNLMIHLKQDAVFAGELPPEQPTRRILEAQVASLKLQWGERWMPQQAWVTALRSQVQFNTCQFWGLTAYVTQAVPQHLQALFQESGLEGDLLQPCIHQYQQWHKAARYQWTQTITAPLQLTLQNQIAEQIAQQSQRQALEDLIETGVITRARGSSLLQSIETQ